MKSFSTNDLLLANFVRDKAYDIRHRSLLDCSDETAADELRSKPFEFWIRKAYRLIHATALIIEDERINANDTPGPPMNPT